jgi:hypothetical protein
MLINGGPGETFNGIVTFFWRSTPTPFSSSSSTLSDWRKGFDQWQMMLMIREGGAAQFAD